MTSIPADASCYRLSVLPAPADDAFLTIRLDGRGYPDGPGLEYLGGDYDLECWSAPDDQLRMLVMSEPDDPDADAAQSAELMYRRLVEQLRGSEFGYPLRLWNYFPAINQGRGDRERYRRFCIGRGRALEAAGLEDARMCAATAIGGREAIMQLVALVGKKPGVSIENPRQVSAWNYPKSYGPRQPAFARATGIRLVDDRVGLLISGTASVVGHDTAHVGDVLAQTDEAASNLDALMVHAAAALGHAGLGHFNADSLARVYVRHPADWPRIEQRLRKRWPELRLCGLQGDICRSELLMEIEAWHQSPGASRDA